MEQLLREKLGRLAELDLATSRISELMDRLPAADQPDEGALEELEGLLGERQQILDALQALEKRLGYPKAPSAAVKHLRASAREELLRIQRADDANRRRLSEAMDKVLGSLRKQNRGIQSVKGYTAAEAYQGSHLDLSQ